MNSSHWFPLRVPASQRGVAIVETAIMLPALILMSLGTMDFARAFFAGIAVESAARSGAQFGSYSAGKAGAAGGIKQAAENEVVNQGLSGIVISSRTFCGCNSDMTELSCSTATCSGRTPAGYVETTATYTFKPLFAYPGIPASIPIRSVVRIRVQ